MSDHKSQVGREVPARERVSHRLISAVILSFCLMGCSNGISWWKIHFDYLKRFVISDHSVSWTIIGVVGLYFFVYVFVQYRNYSAKVPGSNTSSLWLAWALFFVFLHCLMSYRFDRVPESAMIFLTGGLFGLVTDKYLAGVCQKGRIASDVILIVLFLLCIAALCPNGAGAEITYRGQVRWRGIWENPNIYGLLMGTGFIITVALCLHFSAFFLGSKQSTVKNSRAKLVVIPILAASGILMLRGVLYSYSRGAWTGCFFAGVYIFYKTLGNGLAFSAPLRILRRNGVCLTLLGCASTVLIFWCLTHSEGPLTQRILSPFNPYDFSWRNRVAAWKGALQIIAQHFWTGVGWIQSETVYKQFYLAHNIEEAGAVQLNDYLMIGTATGFPTLLCFVLYLFSCFVRSKKDDDAVAWSLGIPAESLGPLIICRAGMIVLLIGFCFDGGLFDVPTASVFWILLELSSLEPREKVKYSAVSVGA